MSEEWKTAVGFEGRLEVSSIGRVRSIQHIDERNRLWPERVLKPYGTGRCRRYMAVSISGRNVKVHRLVAATFLPPDHLRTSVNHKNGDPTDNRVENLEWCTTRENVKHAFDVLGRAGCGGHSGKSGARHHCSRAISAKLPDGSERHFGSASEAARALGLGRSSVIRVANGVYASTKGHRFVWT